jgi:hypothetical protein
MTKSIRDALTVISVADRGLTHRRCSPNEITLDALHSLAIGRSEPFPLGDHAAEAIRRLLGIPQGLLVQLQENTSRLVVNDLLSRYVDATAGATGLRSRLPEPSLVVLISRGRVEGLVEGGLPCISNAKIIGVLRATFADAELERAVVRRCEIDPHAAFSLDLTFETHATEPRVGDIVQAGFSVSHSPVGDQATQVSMCLYRLACANGMLVPVCNGNRRSRTRRDVGKLHSEEAVLARLAILLDDARRQMSRALGQLKTLAETRARPIDELRLIAGRRRFNRGLTQSLERALDEDEAGPAGDTQYDVLQALSRVATHGNLSRRTRGDLLRYAGVYSQGDHYRRCPYCHSIVMGRTPLVELN